MEPGFIERVLIRLYGEPSPSHVNNKKARVVDIMGREDVTQLYLRRFILLKTRWFRIYLHKVVKSDDDADPHDHRWLLPLCEKLGWVTAVLSGGYIDEQWAGGHTPEEIATIGPRKVVNEERMPPGSIKARGRHLHRLILMDPSRATWTLVLIGRQVRKWGFVTPDRGWIESSVYLKERRHPQVAE